ncbi:MAG: tRNA-dihydrouridine synthase A [Amphiamblys sp. WSBS2006]|nr:MAG: tRNA-dihydrouridine synthase A [Amphiamblys sp. WSBS2006]
MDKLSVAPMMKFSHKYFRVFHRILSSEATLYTEMLTANEVLHLREDVLADRIGVVDERTVVQLAGSDPEKVSSAVGKVRMLFNVQNFNLNVGCPSTHAQAGKFGAVLMKDSQTVCAVVKRVFECHAGIDLSIKCRLGVDEDDEKAAVYRFVDAVAKCGVRKFIVHARKALLKFKKTKLNRSVPPLRKDIAVELARDREDLEIVVNGGVGDLLEVKELLSKGVHGVMIGRKAFSDAGLFLEADREVFGKDRRLTKEEAIEQYRQFLKENPVTKNNYLRAIHPLKQIVSGMCSAGAFRRVLAEGERHPEELASTIEKACSSLGQTKRQKT